LSSVAPTGDLARTGLPRVASVQRGVHRCRGRESLIAEHVVNDLVFKIVADRHCRTPFQE
jgi:hypothetical protein